MAQTNIRVRELVDKVQRGEIALPEMQRRYVWPATRVRNLLDSLYRGYPSGTILVWETDEEIETRSLAVQATRMPTTSQRLLLLDGQQRVTSLSAVLAGEPVHVRRRRRPIEILFNLEHPDGPPIDLIEGEDDEYTADVEDVEDEETAQHDIQEDLKKLTFVVAGRALKNVSTWVPVSDIFKKTESQILRAIGISSEDERWDKYSERLRNVRKIEDYQYVMEVLEKRMSYEEVTEIFVRVNSLGIKLRSSDLALAQITCKWKGFMKLVEEFAGKFGDDSDYVVETGLPIRALTVFATKQSRYRTIGKVRVERLKEVWERQATEGLKFAINFLRQNAGIDNLSFMSSPLLLIPIAVYWILKDNKALTPEEEKKLLRWFYFAHMRGHYSMGSSETILDADLSILFKEKGLDGLIWQLELHVKKLDVDHNDIVSRGVRSPFFSMLYFILRQQGIKDWWSGLKLSDQHIGNAHSIQYHHIFPKSLLTSYEKKEVNEMANMAFIGGKANRRITNKAPIDYLPEEVIAKRGEEALTSQFIPLEKRLWEIENYHEFLAYRRESIAEAINVFMKTLE